MLDYLLDMPRWLRVLIAAAILAYPVYLLMRGIVWPWGLALGGCLLVVSILPPLGPPRRKAQKPQFRNEIPKARTETGPEQTGRD